MSSWACNLVIVGCCVQFAKCIILFVLHAACFIYCVGKILLNSFVCLVAAVILLLNISLCYFI